MIPIEQARAAVAARYEQEYTRNSILAGDWDRGSLVKDELAKIEKTPGAVGSPGSAGYPSHQWDGSDGGVASGG